MLQRAGSDALMLTCCAEICNIDVQNGILQAPGLVPGTSSVTTGGRGREVPLGRTVGANCSYYIHLTFTGALKRCCSTEPLENPLQRWPASATGRLLAAHQSTLSVHRRELVVLGSSRTQPARAVVNRTDIRRTLVDLLCMYVILLPHLCAFVMFSIRLLSPVRSDQIDRSLQASR